MNNIVRHSGNNNGGICSIKLVDINNVISTNVINNDTEYKMSVELKSGTDWTDIYFTSGTENFEEVQNDVDNGTYYVQKLEFSIPKDRQDVIKTLLDLSYTRMLALIKYDNGDEIVIGTPDYPLMKSNKRKVSNINTNQYDILIEGKSEFPAYFYYE
jgi:hypothetical protein